MTQSSVVKNPQTKFDAFAEFIGASFEANPFPSFLVAVCVFIFSVAATAWLLVGAFDRVVPRDPSIAIGKESNKEGEKSTEGEEKG
ncbi:hypothetical protein V499_06070 [Pseudogymnoascus sp. VKM F-103]|nr:hypothetical protein V499_06070 [Pseudogymnoascus sp. VKM F-103]